MHFKQHSKYISSSSREKNRNQVGPVIRLNGCRASALAGVFHLEKQFRCYDILADLHFLSWERV